MADLASLVGAAPVVDMELGRTSREHEQGSNEGRSRRSDTPERTEQRWLKRLASSARQAVVLMVSRGAELVRAVGEAVGLQATRRSLVDSYGGIVEVPCGRVLGAVAAVLERLERGVRLM